MEWTRPAEVFPPGEHLRDELEARGWSQMDLAEILGVSVASINEVINNKRGITAEMAAGLSDAFGTSAEFWMNLDARYRLYSTEPKPARQQRAAIFAKVPVREMVKRGWILPSNSSEVLAAAACQFLRIDSLDQEAKPLAFAARKAATYDERTPAQTAWLCRAGFLADGVAAEAGFDPARLPDLASDLRRLALEVECVDQVPRVLSHYGVRFVVVEPLSVSRVEAVTFRHSDGQPVIAMSLRLGKLNNFWHNLLHEVAHIRAGDDLVLDTDSSFEGAGLPPAEQEANRFAVETLIPSERMKAFIDQKRPAFTLAEVKRFAMQVGVHPAIVIGQLAHAKEVTWARFGAHLPGIRERIIAAAVTDGWGHEGTHA